MPGYSLRPKESCQVGEKVVPLSWRPAVETALIASRRCLDAVDFGKQKRNTQLESSNLVTVI